RNLLSEHVASTPDVEPKDGTDRLGDRWPARRTRGAWFFRRRILGSELGSFHGPFLEKHREQTQDRHVEAELGNRWMAEQPDKAGEMQERAQEQEHHQRGRGIGDERRQKDAVDHELGKSMGHARPMTWLAARRVFLADVSCDARAARRIAGTSRAASALRA